MARPTTFGLCFVLLASGAFAQQPGMPGGAGQPGGLPGGRMQRPPRDAREPATGTSVIRGRIVAADTGSPIRRAQVRAFSPEGRDSRGTSTDAQGRFELRDLPAGRWELVASKAGFVTLRFGQRRPLEAGRPIELGDGEVMAKADIALPRGGAVTGRVVDEFGDPVAGARVQSMRFRPMQGTRQLVPFGQDQTDDTGAFRLYGLTPGDYYISAIAQAGMFSDESNDTTGYAPTYYPATPNVAEAQRVSVGVGEEVSGINIALQATRAVRIAGTVANSRGERLDNGFIMVVDASETSGGMMFNMRSGGRIRPDGTFTISNLTPGPYNLTVNTGMGPGGGENAEFASVRVTVGNEDLAGLAIVTGKGATVSGSIVPAPGAATNLQTAGVMVLPEPVRMDAAAGFGFRPGRVEPDGTFRLSGVHGQRFLRVTGLPPNWMLKAVLVNGDDVTDKPIEFRGDEELTDVQILVTDRVTQVTGRVTNAKGDPTRDYTVIVFPEDASKWGFPSRYVRSGRADQEGMYRIRALPPDEQYLAVAVDYVEEGEGGDPDFLRQMRDVATRVTLGDGESKALDLRLITRGS